MLLFYSVRGEKYSLQEIVKDYFILRSQDGNNTIGFKIDVDHALYKLIQTECVVEDDDNRYLVKKIDNGRIECSLDFDFLKQKVFKDYKSESQTVYQALVEHLGSSWTILNPNISTIRRTIEFEHCTSYDVVQQCMTTYDVRFAWHTLTKTVTIYDPEKMNPTGEYLTDELNLRKLAYKAETTQYITRLYAYGEDGLTFASINDGKPYVENYSYSSKIVCGYWSDNRYTVKENLLASAEKKIKTLAFPITSYECDVIDLAKSNTEKYRFLDFALHKVVTLIDRERGLKVNHHIVQYKEYPNEPNRNVITLSAVPDTITSSIDQIVDDFIDEIGIVENGMENAIKKATEYITTQLGGYVVKRENELLIMDTPYIETAVRVWRWNLGGLGYSSTGYDGPYATAITMDGSIVANFITTGILSSIIIQSNNYIKDKEGTIINLDDGTFSFAGGNLTYDGDILQLIGKIISDCGIIAGWEITPSAIISPDEMLRLESSEITPLTTWQWANSNGYTWDDIKHLTWRKTQFINSKQIGECQIISKADDKMMTIKTGELSFYDGDEEAYTQRMKLDNGGQRFYAEDSSYLGFTGTNHNGDKQGIVFDLDMAGDYMSWGVKEQSDGPYMQIFSYYRDDDDFTFARLVNIEGDLNVYGGLYIPNDQLINLFSPIHMNGWDIYDSQFVSSSDAKLKVNIYDSDIKALDIINDIYVAQFDWIDNDVHENIGFIAQQIEQIDKSLVAEIPQKNCDNILGVKETRLIRYLVKAMQEQTNIIDELNRRIEVLENG